MSGRPDSFMACFWGDYARDTGRLNNAGHGAYLMLIKNYWCDAKALPDDDATLWRMACCDNIAAWRRLRPAVEGFFYVFNGLWVHKRVEEELEDAARRYARHAEGARLANAKRSAKRSGERTPSAQNADAERDAEHDAERYASHARATTTTTLGKNPLESHSPDQPKPNGANGHAALPPDGAPIYVPVDDPAFQAARLQQWALGSPWPDGWGPPPANPACLAREALSDAAVDDAIHRRASLETRQP